MCGESTGLEGSRRLRNSAKLSEWWRLCFDGWGLASELSTQWTGNGTLATAARPLGGNRTDRTDRTGRAGRGPTARRVPYGAARAGPRSRAHEALTAPCGEACAGPRSRAHDALTAPPHRWNLASAREPSEGWRPELARGLPGPIRPIRPIRPIPPGGRAADLRGYSRSSGLRTPEAPTVLTWV